MTGTIQSIEELKGLQAQFLTELGSARRVLIASHLNPDGDAIGSSLAVAAFLTLMGVDCDVVNADPVPENLKFLPGVNRVKSAPAHDEYDLGIILDLDSMNRLGRVRDCFNDIPRLMVIDHHVPHEQPGDLRIVMTGAPATCALLADLMLGSGIPLTSDIANYLLVGILTDTGNFRFPNTTPHSLHLAAELIELGADLPKMAEEVYHRKPIEAVRLLGWALSNFKTSMNDSLVWVTLPLRIFEELGASDQDTEGIVNEILSVGSARIAMILRESAGGRIRGSLRSRGSINVATVAQQFGGGGHANAAGVSFTSSLSAAEEEIVKALEECLASS
ncbi:MAG: bifunctional oligoribonuclease/PAP phosphatase NrnA [Fimbriimonadaceae bacterium]|nr:bifunctional oligoribonuclease/PAP phosphatase NrnA [Fimbriimonadaceae bacterium]